MKYTESNTRTMKFVCLDNFDRPVYKCLENNTIWKDLSDFGEQPQLYSCQNEVGGEPDYHINEMLKIVFVDRYVENPNRFEYMMLDRLRIDCAAHLGVSNRKIEDVDAHFAEMKRLWNLFPEKSKPEWLTWEQILDYEKKIRKEDL
ncbi:MAG: LPD11 domain-containing protein [Oscillospiraceae bacterium]